MISNKTRQDNRNKYCLYQNRIPDIYFRWLWWPCTTKKKSDNESNVSREWETGMSGGRW